MNTLINLLWLLLLAYNYLYRKHVAKGEMPEWYYGACVLRTTHTMGQLFKERRGGICGRETGLEQALTTGNKMRGS